uniref:ABC transporter C family member 5-like n=1 Tax=Rhizophora mucronata TaxID=61149 RepID=A0A2P2KAC6_RHIMU
MQERKLDLPEPTMPQTATLIPPCTFICIPDNVGLDEEGSQQKAPFLISKAKFVICRGRIIVASSCNSSSCRNPEIRSRETFVCAIIDTRSGKFLSGSCNILKVARAERTPPAVS